MKLYRKVIPKIAKDVVRSLLAHRYIEVEEGRRDEAELDLAGALVEYLNAIDQLKTDALEAIERHGLSPEQLVRVKKSLAASRKLGIGEDAHDYVIQRMIDVLFNSKHIEEVFGEDHDLRRVVVECVNKYIGVDEELDREVRGRIKQFREGTLEWESEYSRIVGQMRAARA